MAGGCACAGGLGPGSCWCHLNLCTPSLSGPGHGAALQGRNMKSSAFTHLPHHERSLTGPRKQRNYSANNHTPFPLHETE